MLRDAYRKLYTEQSNQTLSTLEDDSVKIG